MTTPAEGTWWYSKEHRQPCKVVEAKSLWGRTICRVWLPGADEVARLPAASLESLEASASVSADQIVYIAAAARIAEALQREVLLAPIESSVIPLPHQVHALSRAVSSDRVRYLLADEVGLGKTIEAGLIMRELKLRGMVRRTLVVAPKGLASQWVSEMHFHFGEPFQLVLPEDLKTLRRLAPFTRPGGQEDGARHDARLANVWEMLSQVVVPMDSIKPLERRRGWSATQLGEHNRERFEDLISAGWDLVIIDEAHRLGGSTDQVARFKLGQGLAAAAPYLLLLSATPHQGKTDAFHRIVSLIDPLEFSDVDSVTKERVSPYVIRTEKRNALGADGKPLFKPRRTQLVPVPWESRHRRQLELYDAVTTYVRDGYNKAMRESRSYIGFLMILMQRLVVSSTSAIRATLERRLEALTTNDEQLTLFPRISEEELLDLDGQEQVEALIHAGTSGQQSEQVEVRRLLEAAVRCGQAGPDAKAEALLEWLYRLQSEENDPDLKALVFTEFVPTQVMLSQFLSERGFSVVCLNGSMDMQERKHVQEAFSGEARVLISTDAGGEGLNLQFCHVVINYDIPWNPMRLEQRIGRVDRIGQARVVRAINFVCEGSVEHRVREVLEKKLAVILEEFGIDKTGDVLDTAEAAQMFDQLYVNAILNPDKVPAAVDGAVRDLKRHVGEVRHAMITLGSSTQTRPAEVDRLLTHPLPHWLERMVVSFLNSHGGCAKLEERDGWHLEWPDGGRSSGVVFSASDLKRWPSARHMSMEDPRLRDLVRDLPNAASGQVVPRICVRNLPSSVRGLWSLWRISIEAAKSSMWRILPLFRADDGRVLAPTARHVWERLLDCQMDGLEVIDTVALGVGIAELEHLAAEHGRPIYEDLCNAHSSRLGSERERVLSAFEAQRQRIGRTGLPEVRSYRLNRVAQEEQAEARRIELESQVSPDLTALLIARIEGSDHE